jgi:sialate O-acetylesterase
MRWTLLICLFFCFTPVLGQLRLSGLFSDNMILQRNQPIRVFGTGVPGKLVELRFFNRFYATMAEPDSSWSVVMEPLGVNSQPQKLVVISGRDSIITENILVGDVWLCTGQSNMEWPFSRDAFATEETALAEQPQIRLYNTTYAGKYVYGVPYTDSVLATLNTEEFYSGGWEPCTPQTVQSFSAIGYYFAKKITAETGIPIGVINLAIGGAPIETFISKEALAADPQFKQKATGNWLLNSTLPEWIRERGLQNLGHLSGASSQQGPGPDHAYKPGFAYAASIPVFAQLPVAGILFYQGESNSLEAPRVFEYGSLLKLLVRQYRQQWKQPNLPFYWVQLSSIDTSFYKSGYWPAFRDLQRKMLDSISFSGMAVTSDIGDPRDVHPRNKRTVGNRLAAWALHYKYGRENIIPSGPLIKDIRVRKNRLILSFRYSSGGLATSDGQHIRGFSVDGKTGTTVKIKRKKIVLPFNSKPSYVYYGWAPYSSANLINKAGLPASTFRKKIN